MKIAVVGSGAAGMTAAWLLQRRHEVVVFEREPRIGGHAHTVDVREDGHRVSIDTGFIVYNERNYPNLCGLFEQLRVPTQASDMSFGASIGNGAIEYAGSDLNTLFGQRRNLMRPSHWSMLREILRFNREARAVLDDVAIDEQTLGDFLVERRFGRAMIDRYLMPMAAAIWSCPTAVMLDFPARSFLQFFHNHGLLDLNDRPQWRTVLGGSREYLQAMRADFRGRIVTGEAVRGVRREQGGVRVRTDAGEHDFDRIVLACHADETLTLLEDGSFWERQLLGAFSYQPNRVLLHTDTALMPRRRRVWSSWNYLADRASTDERRVSVTYWMNRLQNLPTQRDYFVSLNPLHEPRPECVVGEYHYDHPVFRTGALHAQHMLHRLQGDRQTWFCGAYFGYGFHEDAVSSAVAVAGAFGIEAPWRERGQVVPLRRAVRSVGGLGLAEAG